MPLAALVLMLLIALSVVKHKCLQLSQRGNMKATKKEVAPMTNAKQLGFSAVLETIWGVGTGAVAGALST
jgi:hypothetical protein